MTILYLLYLRPELGSCCTSRVGFLPFGHRRKRRQHHRPHSFLHRHNRSLLARTNTAAASVPFVWCWFDRRALIGRHRPSKSRSLNKIFGLILNTFIFYSFGSNEGITKNSSMLCLSWIAKKSGCRPRIGFMQCTKQYFCNFVLVHPGGRLKCIRTPNMNGATTITIWSGFEITALLIGLSLNSFRFPQINQFLYKFKIEQFLN